MKMRVAVALPALFCLVAVGCGEDDSGTTPKTIVPQTDAGVDAGGQADTSSTNDTSSPTDAGSGTLDTTTSVDTTAAKDTNPGPVDAGSAKDTTTVADSDSTPDTGTPDAGSTDAGPEDAGPEDAGPDDVPPVDAGPPVCDPPLKLSPGTLKILPFDLHTFKGIGGTGQYRYKLVKNASGAILNAFNGAYLSGEKSGVQDVVELTDLGCVGVAQAKVSVVADMSIKPSLATVSPGTKFTFQVKGGSGAAKFSFKTNASGGTLSAAGSYVAGKKAGTDIIDAKDSATGQLRTVKVTVKAGSSMFARPARISIPVGSTFTPNVIGGSGSVKIAASGTAFSTKDGKLTAVKPGYSGVTLTDEFTGQKTVIKARSIRAFDPEQPSVGDGFGWAVVRGTGDINDDGYPDAVVGISEGDYTAWNDGIVLVYHGSKKGMGPKPVQILHGTERDGRYGTSLAVGDVDGDGRVDLIVGNPVSDVGTINNGGVHIHKGLKTGKFEKTASKVLSGLYSYDQFGYSVALCDFNGDKRLDLAVGAPYGEDRTKSPTITDEGGVFVFLGGKDGFADKPEIRRFGTDLDAAGKPKKVKNLRMGWSLAAGDIDGDGLCDLAAGSLHYRGNANNDGAVFIYKGVAATKSSAGGLTGSAVHMITGTDKKEKGGQFGRAIGMGDFDGDKRADLVVGYYGLDTYPGGKKQTNAGGVFAYKLTGIGNKPATKKTSYLAAQWKLLGDNSWDYYGRNVHAQDLDGDGISEIIASDVADEIKGKPSGTGVVAIFKGRKGKFPDTKPSLAIPGVRGGDWFGAGVSTVGDVDKDGSPDLVVYASHEDTVGMNHGRPYFVSGAKPFSPQPLEYVTRPSGSRIGHAMAAIGDVNQDGKTDFVVTAPYSEGAEKVAGKWVFTSTTAGSSWVLSGATVGTSQTPALAIHKFYGHTGGELLGWDADGAGDFDGDGIQDYAVVARNEDRHSAWGSGYASKPKCGSYGGDVGAVYIFKGGKKLSKTPVWMILGVQTYDYIMAVGGAQKPGMGDINGDGLDDIVMGSYAWDASGRSNAGGWAVAWGRKAPAKGIGIVCKPDHMFVGVKSNDYVGRSVAMIGDIDGDKCAEFAVGADAEDLGLSNQGTVRVIFGWGAKCKSKTPREVVLLSGSNNARAGISVASGGDVDGDKLNDLVIGGYNHVVAGQGTGAAWVVTAKYIKTLTPKTVVNAAAPLAKFPMSDPKAGKLNVAGTVPGGQFGYSVSLIPGFEADGRAAVIVGFPFGNVFGKDRSGGAQVYRVMKGTKTSLAQQPWGAIAGETYRSGGAIGYSVAGANVGGKVIIGAGGYYGTPQGSKAVDGGSAYMTLLDK